MSARKGLFAVATVVAVLVAMVCGVRVVEAATTSPVASCSASPTITVGATNSTFSVKCSVPNQVVTKTVTATATTTVTATPQAPAPTTSAPAPAPSTTTAAPAAASGLCTNPVATVTDPNGDWAASYDQYGNPIGPVVNQDIWGASGSYSQQLGICSPTSWNVTANYTDNGGAIQTYPDTQYVLGGKTVAQYNSMQTCFGDQHPTGGEWDYGYDVWADNWNVEIMVWNDWTDTGIYPPAGARAVTIDGVAYHEWKGGGTNEWIYTRDDHATSGCLDMLSIFKDLIAHEPTSKLTSSSVPGAIEYGVEIASTKGSETFNITNVSLTTN